MTNEVHKFRKSIFKQEVERVYNQKHARDRINDALNEIEFQQSINDAARRLIK